MPQDPATKLAGFIRGPFCAYSTTLTADYPLHPSAEGGVNAIEGQVLEPCYWTPLTPFLYELQLQLEGADGTEQKMILNTGMKRLQCLAGNLFLEQKRIVLRGMCCNTVNETALQEAHRFETSLVVNDASMVSSGDFNAGDAANQYGVPLVVDLRSRLHTWQDAARLLDWHPAVVVILVCKEQLADVSQSWQYPRHSAVALCISANTTPQDLQSLPFTMLAVELEQGQRPPAWATGYGRPVLALRLGERGEIRTARRRCDRLQAELAPEFNLAGYFV